MCIRQRLNRTSSLCIQHMNYCRVDDIEKREVLKHQLAH